MKLELQLPYPPSTNTYLRYVRGRPILSKRVREYRQEVYAAVLAMNFQVQVAKASWGDHPLFLGLTLFPPDTRNRDVDNPVKPLLDALQHAGVMDDDCQVGELHVRRLEVRRGGLALVQLEEVTTMKGVV